MDINKRTILWIVFAVSLVILWNNWQVSTGRPSMFAPAPAQTAKAPEAKKSDLPAASATATGAAALPGAGATAAAEPFKSERITVTTDVFRVDIDTLGGTIKRLELLKFKDGVDPTKNQVLFDVDGATGKTYLAETGLVGAPGLPNHQTGFVAKPGPRMLNDANQVRP